MNNWEAKMLEKFSEAVEDAISAYLADKNMTKEALKEYFGNMTMLEKIQHYIDVIR